MNLIPQSSPFDFDRFFEDFYAPARRMSAVMTGFFSPSVDIVEKDNKYEISAELPGAKKEDVQVHLNDGLLTIEAEVNQEDKEEKEGKMIRQERRYGKFVRSFNLGTGITEKDIQAEFEDGVLKVSAPKSPESKHEKRRIQIS